MTNQTPTKESDWIEQPKDALQKVKNAVSATTEKAQQKMGEVGRAVQETIDENRGTAAQKMQTVASKLHENADSVAGFAHTAAEKMEASADYVRDHNVKDMAADCEAFVRRHPGQSLIAAVAVGFLLGRAMKSDD